MRQGGALCRAGGGGVLQRRRPFPLHLGLSLPVRYTRIASSAPNVTVVLPRGLMLCLLVATHACGRDCGFARAQRAVGCQDNRGRSPHAHCVQRYVSSCLTAPFAIHSLATFYFRPRYQAAVAFYCQSNMCCMLGSQGSYGEEWSLLPGAARTRAGLGPISLFCHFPLPLSVFSSLLVSLSEHHVNTVIVV